MSAFEFPWERAAMRGDILPDGLELPDAEAYTTMRCVYAQYKAGTLTKEQASQEKQKIRAAWENGVKTWAFWGELIQKEVQRTKATEIAKMNVRRDPTPENAMRLVRVLDGLEG